MRGLPYRCLLALERRPHEHLQPAVVAGVRRFRAALPGVEAAARDAQTPTQDRDRVRGLLRRDEAKPYRLCFAKKAAAFFRMSRSSCEIAHFLAQPRQLLALRGRQAGLALASDPRAPARPSSRSADSVRSRSRAAAPTVLPSSRTRRTAPALNSSVNCRACARRFVCRPWSGHRIRLSEDVHQTGSSPERDE